jgi:hypothetical protein
MRIEHSRIWIALAILSCFSTSLGARPTIFELASVAPGSLKWHAPNSVELFGAQVQWRSFTADVSVHETAQNLALRTDLFQRVMALKDKIVLSGFKSGWHWVAEVSANRAGAAGLVSALRVGQSQSSHALDRNGQFGWLPPDAHLRFSQRESHGGRHVVQRVYDMDLSVDQLLIHVERALRASGWIADHGLATSPGTSTWQRDASRLTLFARDSIGRSSLFVHHLE